MLCPYCGKEMKTGFLQAASNILFSEKKHILHMRPSNEQDILLARQSMYPAAVTAHYCEDCHKFIIENDDIV